MAVTTTRQDIPELEADTRERFGSREAARIREKGRIPAVIYGHGQGTAHVAIDRIEMTGLLREHYHLLQVIVDGTTEPVLVKEQQWNHLGSELMHVDLTRVDLDESVTVEVELELSGEDDAPGLKAEGAILHQERTVIEVVCRATDIPSSIKVDVSELEVGDSVAVSDLDLPAGVETTLEPDDTIVSITVVQEEPEEEEEVALAAGEEPEVIGAAEEEGEEGAEAAEGEAAGGDEGEKNA